MERAQEGWSKGGKERRREGIRERREEKGKTEGGRESGMI